MMTTILIMGIGAYLPASPVGPFLGFVPLLPLCWLLLAVTLQCHVAMTQGHNSAAKKS